MPDDSRQEMSKLGCCRSSFAMPQVVAAFYKFVELPDRQLWQQRLLALCQAQAIKGTILLAPEGINGTVAGSPAAIDTLLLDLRSDPRFADLEVKAADTALDATFDRLKIKLKSEIITIGQPDADPSVQVGTYVDPADWNRLIQDPNILVIDTRNELEVSIGTFPGAQNPQTSTFREFPTYVQQSLDPAQHKQIAMFCTGGIRCEKASAYLLAQGFEQVYHLKGGILNYLETVPPEESLWTGECFVFDHRVAVTHGVEDGSYTACLSCGWPIGAADRAAAAANPEGGACPRCHNGLTPARWERFARPVAGDAPIGKLADESAG
jgi:UPF0176 protein